MDVRPTLTATVFRVAAVLLIVALAVGCGAPSQAPAAAPMASDSAENAMAREFDSASAQEQPLPEGGAPALLNRKMVARATLDMVVADAGETVESIRSLMGEVGGFIATENLYNEAYGEETPRLRGNLTLRVPAEALETTLNRLETLAVEVGNRTLEREDVTDQYTDLDAQLVNLRATETELREMLTEVREKPNAKPEDILAVHNRLTEIRGQIEQVQGRKNMLENLIGLSAISVNLAPDRSMLPVVQEGWQPGNVMRDALRLLVTSLQGLGNFAIWMIFYVLPVALVTLLPIALVVLLVVWLVRRRRGSKRLVVNSGQ